MDTNNLIRLTNKVLSNEYNKEFKQYSKEDSKVYLIIIIYYLTSNSDPYWAYADYSLFIYREKTLFKKTL